MAYVRVISAQTLGSACGQAPKPWVPPADKRPNLGFRLRISRIRFKSSDVCGKITYRETTPTNNLGVISLPILTQEIKDLISATEFFPFATASKEGAPNVIPVACLKVYDDQTLLIVDNYFGKTLQNLRENPHVSTCAWDAKKRQCFQIKGSAKVYTEGKPFVDAVEWLKVEKPQHNPKSAVLIKIEEIYVCIPGPDLGKKL